MASLPLQPTNAWSAQSACRSALTTLILNNFANHFDIHIFILVVKEGFNRFNNNRTDLFDQNILGIDI